MPRAPHMVLRPHDSQDLALDLPQIVRDTRVGESHCQISIRDQNRVARSILFELRFKIMPLAAVDLDDEPVAYDEVDPTDAGDGDLRPNTHSPGAKTYTKDRLGARFGFPST